MHLAGEARKYFTEFEMGDLGINDRHLFLGHAAPQASRALVDPTFPLHEFIQWFRGRLVCREPDARAHFERVRLSTFAGSAVQLMMAANGSS
jgi:hypothetical protein